MGLQIKSEVSYGFFYYLQSRYSRTNMTWGEGKQRMQKERERQGKRCHFWHFSACCSQDQTLHNTLKTFLIKHSILCWFLFSKRDIQSGTAKVSNFYSNHRQIFSVTISENSLLRRLQEEPNMTLLVLRTVHPQLAMYCYECLCFLNILCTNFVQTILDD